MADKAPLITCICTGNICRSPMAAKLLQHALGAENDPWSSYRIISAGVSAANGNPASTQAINALKKVGLDLTNHRSNQVTKKLIEDSIVVFCMTESHRQYLRRLFPQSKIPIQLFREHIPSSEEKEISDPFGSNLAVYESCRDSIVEAIPYIIKYLKNSYSPE
jgi:protein-tyrosine phosphatase